MKKINQKAIQISGQIAEYICLWVSKCFYQAFDKYRADDKDGKKRKTNTIEYTFKKIVCTEEKSHFKIAKWFGQNEILK